MRIVQPFTWGILALALAACGGAPAPSNTSSAGAVQPVAIQSTSEMMSLLNFQRASQGLGPVQEDARLSRSAQAHAADMEANGYFSHQGQNGSRFYERAAAAGYACAAAENIASGQPSEDIVVRGWMGSDGHRRNILLSDATEFGIGRAGNVWVLVMGRGC